MYAGILVRRFIAVAALLVGCASPTFQRVKSAPALPPSDSVVIVERAPIGAVLIGTAEVQVTVHQTPSECEAIALSESKLAGATHVVLRAASSGSASQGSRCRAEAYYVPK